MNRFWETIFGHGIVETSEDFGSQGDLPSHPELLDWLATEFMQRRLEHEENPAPDSHIGRLSPVLARDTRTLARDPYNLLYARGPRFRVEAEMVHDIALSASGLLVVKCSAQASSRISRTASGIFPTATTNGCRAKASDHYRRAIYTFIRRSAPYPSLVTYDAPSREFCTIRRVRTNTPLQALTGLNDPYFFEAARAMAKRVMAEGGTSPEDRIAYGFRLVVSHGPSKAELERVLNFYRQQLATYQRDTKAETAPELAAWTMVSNVLLNMDEAISKE